MIHDFIASFKQTADLIPVKIDCLPGVVFQVTPISPKRREAISRKSLRRGNIDTHRYNKELIGAAVQGWNGFTEDKMAEMAGTYDPSRPPTPGAEIPYSRENLDAICEISNDFVNQLLAQIGSDEALGDQRREAKLHGALEKN